MAELWIAISATGTDLAFVRQSHDQELEAPPLWIGFQPTPGGGSSVSLAATF